MDQLHTPPWRRRLADWFDTLSDGQRIAALVSAMVFLGASCLYLVGVASILLVYRLGPPPARPTPLAVSAAAPPTATRTGSSSPTSLPHATAAVTLAAVTAEATPTVANTPAETAVPTESGEQPTPIAAPDVPRIRSVARMPEPVPVLGTEPEEDPEAVETRKPRVVATDAAVEETLLPLETPFVGGAEPPSGTPAPGTQATMQTTDDPTKEPRRRREESSQDNEAPPAEPAHTPAPVADEPTAVPTATSAEPEAEPTPKKVKRTPSSDDSQDNDH